MIQPRYADEPKRISNPRTARAATRRRIGHKSKARYASVVQVSITVGTILTFLMGYVVLTSNLTGLTYAVARAQHQRDALQAESMRLDDRLSALRADDRLSVLAARLGMQEPQRFAVVRLSPPQTTHDRMHLAVLSSLAGFFMPAAVPRQR